MEKGQIEHYDTDRQGEQDAVTQGFFRAVKTSRARVLGHKGGHGLHKGRRHQHNEGTDLLRDADSRGGDDAEGIDDCLNNQKRNADQQVLRRYGQAQPGHAGDDVSLESNLIS